MRLADFIRQEMEAILQNWEEFAETRLPAYDMSKAELRDHAREMLLTIAANLDHSRDRRERPSELAGLDMQRDTDSPAEIHGVQREQFGFSINDTISEFRELRANVIELWTRSTEKLTEHDLDEITRFNEAIYQAVTGSVASYAAKKERDARLLETIMLTSPDIIYVLDLEGIFRYVNKATENLFALSQEMIVDKAAFDFEFPFSSALKAHFDYVLECQAPNRGEINHTFASGQEGVFEYLLTPVFDGYRRMESIVVTLRNITERKSYEEKVWHSANYDLLTGLPNRRLFFERLKQEVKKVTRTGHPLAVLFVDLDGFKEVNDSLGHEAGDRLLGLVAERLTTCVRQDDTAARLGGDEFTVVLTNLQKDSDETPDVSSIAQEISNAISEPFYLDGRAIQISASIGITLCPQNSTTAEGLVREADQAMYIAKKAGRNQLYFYQPTDK